jgi:hypothetical protein
VILLVATTLLVAVALVAAYFTVRASLAIEGLRKDITVSRKHMKEVTRLAHRTTVQQDRVNDKLYRSVKEIEAMMADPTVQRALRVTEKPPSRGV